MELKNKYILFIFMGLTLLNQACSSSSSESSDSTDSFSAPNISTFLTTPSDQFIIDTQYIYRGHPYKGDNANTPHAGGHAHVANLENEWPLDGTAPENYVPIYAVADGEIDRVESYYLTGENYAYHIALHFADTDAGRPLEFLYSIEPFIDPADETFYEDFILVTEGQEVAKGDVIAYFYIPPDSIGDTHIHFHIENNGAIQAPAIFTSEVVAAFAAQWGETSTDDGDVIPECMGYKITAEQNPFEEQAEDCL